MNKHKYGFTVVEALAIILIIAVLGFVGYKVFASKKEQPSQNNTTTNNASNNNSSDEPVIWRYNEQKLEYFATEGTPPKCKEPFKFEYTPVDLSLVNVIGMPGAYRGFSYKPHGGLRADSRPQGNIEVKMPTTATLTSLTRYYEMDELQYLVTFETDCGIAFRFDHLHTLTPKLQAIAETRPEPKKDDTRSDPNNPPPRTVFNAGEVVAKRVGFPKKGNAGFDFGVYDYRERNEISKTNKKWADMHRQYSSLDYHGVCWTDMLPGNDAAKAKELSLVVLNPQKPNLVSDYCEYAPHTTLDFNDGKPTDG